MKNAVRVILILLVLLIAFISTRPSTYHVERSVVVASTGQAIYPHVQNFHEWDAWSPWAKLDPAMKTDFAGPDSGVGAVYHWVGNSKVGEGRMTVTEVQPGQRVGIRIEFIKPFASTSQATFTFDPAGSGTKVTWAMDGHNNFVAKCMGLFMNMDKMIGPDFERGLGALKRASETTAAPADSSAHAGSQG